MVIYLDASALIKLYVMEKGSDLLLGWMNAASLESTALITWAEVAAALAKGERMGAITRKEALAAWQQFMTDWDSLVIFALSEALIRRAGDLAWKHHLRGYDAVHLASALACQESVAQPVTLITFDQQLWRAGQAEGLEVLPTEQDL